MLVLACASFVSQYDLISSLLTNLELRQGTKDSSRSQIRDSGREPAQINITYSKKLQDNIDLKKKKKKRKKKTVW